MTATYDFSSKDVSLQAKFDPVTAKITTNANGGAVGLNLSTSQSFDI